MQRNRPAYQSHGTGGHQLCGPLSKQPSTFDITQYSDRLILISPLYTISLAATLAPRIDIYTQLACAIHKPEYTMRQNGSDTDFISVQTAPLGSIRIDRCAADPEVQAAVATFLTGLCNFKFVWCKELLMITVSALVMGILSCMTTGWWGSVSARR